MATKRVGQIDTCSVMPVYILTHEDLNFHISDKYKIQYGVCITCSSLCHVFRGSRLILERCTICVYYLPSKFYVNRLTPNDPYMGRTAPLTSKLCILYIYSTNTGTEYFKHALYSPSFSLQNAVCFITLTCLVPVLITFYVQGVLKLKKIIPAPKVNNSRLYWEIFD